MPPFVRDLWHCVCNRNEGPLNQGFVWDGIYSHFRDVPVEGRGFADDDWRRLSCKYLHAIRHEAQQHRIIADNSLGARLPLPLVASWIAQDTKRIRILDLGGGLGPDYLVLVSSLAPDVKVDYLIVEDAEMCDIGAEVFAGERGIRFSTSLPEDGTAFDLVYMNAVLQYLEDYPSMVRRLCSYNSRYVLAVRLLAGRIPTYATAQKNHPGSIIPVWFFNDQELTDRFADQGYRLLSTTCMRWPHDMSNFPESHRLSAYMNLLFCLRGSR